ncbi:tetratricopeptide repeat (TPR)-like superfamily protein [Tasmannia lanceolata]|uniref:tetratricopeptide repeat (TPR)-like superfamily protein n=1 Tax=Tasmannia lanceolata TaxID=3420 RepID=UPI00406324F1
MGLNSASSLLNRLLQNTTHHHHKPKPTPPTNTQSITTSILSHINSGQLKKAVSLIFSSPSTFPPYIYTRLFQLCSSKHALVETRKLESHLITSSPSPSTFLLNRAIGTYGKCGSLKDARELFDEMPHRDGGTWNAMITAYSQAGCPRDALALFSHMNSSGIPGNEITFAGILGSCAALLALFLTRQIHGLVIRLGFCWNVVLGSSLVDIYGKCWIICDARRMFDEIPRPNAISWNVIIRRYLEMGQEEEAVVMFFKMVRGHIRSLNFTFSNALIACSSICALKEGSRIHGIVVKIGFEEDDVVTTSLIDMYVKCCALEDARRLFDQPSSRNVFSWTSMVSGYAMCGRIDEARKLFDEMPERTVVSWNAMLVGYTRFNFWDEALDFIFWMRRETGHIDYVTLGLILNVCAGLSDLELGKQVHGFVYRHGFGWNIFVSNALLDMYGKCGSLRSANLWFFEMGNLRDRISWNTLITGYANHGRSEEALRIFGEMQWEAAPSEFTFSTVLAACANIFTLDQGKEIHGYMIRNGFETDIIIRGALVDMYSKCRSLDYAINVFKEKGQRDLILYNSMILGCAYNGRGIDVLELFESMQKEGIQVDNVTFVGVLLACVGEGFVDLGQQYFDSMSDKYYIIPRIEHYECMIELFSKHGFLDDLEKFIRRMPFEPTVPMWTRVFDACREYGNSKLGEWAAECLNKLNPVSPVRFEISVETKIFSS